MALDEPNDDDNRIELSGVQLLFQKSINSLLEGQVIDFVNSGYKEGFVVSPEWASGSCG